MFIVFFIRVADDRKIHQLSCKNKQTFTLTINIPKGFLCNVVGVLEKVRDETFQFVDHLMNGKSKINNMM